MGGNAVKAGEPAVQATVIGVDVLQVKRPFDANTRGQTYRCLGMGVQRVGPAIAGFFLTSPRCLLPCCQRLFWVSYRIFIMRWRLCLLWGIVVSARR